MWKTKLARIKKKNGTNTVAGNIKSLPDIREQSSCYLDHTSMGTLFSWKQWWEISCGTEVKTPHIHCRGHQLDSLSGNKDPPFCAVQPKIKNKERMKVTMTWPTALVQTWSYSGRRSCPIHHFPTDYYTKINWVFS